MTASNMGGKINKEILKTLGIIAAALYILISQVVVPNFKTSSNDATTSIIERVVKLETVLPRLEDLPQAVATQTEAINTLKILVEKMGEKLDRHIARNQ